MEECRPGIFLVQLLQIGSMDFTNIPADLLLQVCDEFEYLVTLNAEAEEKKRKSETWFDYACLK